MRTLKIHRAVNPLRAFVKVKPPSCTFPHLCVIAIIFEVPCASVYSIRFCSGTASFPPPLQKKKGAIYDTSLLVLLHRHTWTFFRTTGCFYLFVLPQHSNLARTIVLVHSDTYTHQCSVHAGSAPARLHVHNAPDQPRSK